MMISLDNHPAIVPGLGKREHPMFMEVEHDSTAVAVVVVVDEAGAARRAGAADVSSAKVQAADSSERRELSHLARERIEQADNRLGINNVAAVKQEEALGG